VLLRSLPTLRALLLAALALGWAQDAVAAGGVASGASRRGASSGGCEALGLPASPAAWSFDVGSALRATPTVTAGAGGTILLSASEGYVHALSADGRLLWSYTLRGSPLGGVAVDARGRLYAGTRDRQLLALRATGDADWETTLPWAPSSGLVSDGERLYFGIGRGMLQAWSRWATPLFTVDLGAAPALEPLAVGQERLLVATQGGELRLLQRAWTRWRRPIAGAAWALSAASEERALLLTSEAAELVELKDGQSVAHWAQLVAAGSAQTRGGATASVGLDAQGRLHWLDAELSTRPVVESGRAWLTSERCRPVPQLVAFGTRRVVLTCEQGLALLLDEGGQPTQCWDLQGGAPWPARLGPGAGQLLLATRGGRLWSVQAK